MASVLAQGVPVAQTSSRSTPRQDYMMEDEKGTEVVAVNCA